MIMQQNQAGNSITPFFEDILLSGTNGPPYSANNNSQTISTTND
jgi:hypothetical protein